MANTTAADEHNATAWLQLSDWELIERAGSLDLPADLHPDPYEPTGVIPTKDQLAAARAAADQQARDIAGDTFVDAWVAEYRPHIEHAYLDPGEATHPPIPYYRREDQLRGDGTLQETEPEVPA